MDGVHGMDFQSSLQISDSFRSPESICTSDSFGCSLLFGIYPSDDEANACCISSHLPINQISDNCAETQGDTEQVFCNFDEIFPEREYELSMTDLVVQNPLCTSEGLPIEDNCWKNNSEVCSQQSYCIQERNNASSEKKKFSHWLLHPQKAFRFPSPDEICTESSLVFPSHRPQLSLSTSSSLGETSRGKTSLIGSFTAFSRPFSSKSKRKHFGRTSPKVTPMSSPRRSSTSAITVGLFDVMAPLNVATTNGARYKTPGVKIDANSQCSVCSSYTYFFKSRCQVCGRLYCSNCMQEATFMSPDGMRCQKLCAEGKSKRSMKKSIQACWPFSSRKR